MKRLFITAALLLLAGRSLAAGDIPPPGTGQPPSGNGTCSSSRSEAHEKYWAEIAAEEERVIEGSKRFEPQLQSLRDSNAADIGRNENIAEQYLKDHPATGKLKAVVIGFEGTVLAPDGETDIFTHHHEIHYLLHGMPVRVARFDQEGALIEDRITPIGNALQSGDAFSDGVDGRVCSISFTHDADGQEIISEIEIFGDSERGQIIRGHLWFNEDGLAYRGEKYRPGGEGEPRAVRSGGFQDSRYFPKKIPDSGPLDPVDVPRVVTLSCDACRDLADRRNDIVARIVPVAERANRAAKEFNTSLAGQNKYAAQLRAKAAAKGLSPEQIELYVQDNLTYAQDLPPQKLAYETARHEYDALRAELDAAHAAYMDCEERMCRKPRAASDTPSMSVGAGAGYESLRLPSLSFLGRELPGAAAPTLGLVPAERTLQDARFAGHATFRIGELEFPGGISESVFLDLGIRYFEGNGHEEFGRIDLQGDRLVIPGLGVGSNGNGFVLNYFGGLNSPDDMAINRDYSELNLRGAFFIAPPGDRYREIMGLRFGYSDFDSGADFTGTIPGFARDIEMLQTLYGSEFSVGVFGGIETEIGSGLTLGARFGADLVFVDFDGTNRLRFTGFADQIVEDDGNEIGWDADFAAYLESQVGENVSIVIAAEAFYVGGTTPVWETPGGGEIARIRAGDRFGLSLGVSMEAWW